jgi:hypothetical protein
MQLVKFRTLSLLGSALFFGCVNFAIAAYPNLTGPSYDYDGSFQLSPSLPDSPYFLNDIWMKKDNGSWEPLHVGYRDYAVNVDLSAVGNYEFKTRWSNPSSQPATYTGFSNSILVTVYAIAAPDMASISVPASDTDGNYVVSWGKVARANQYKLERAVNNGAWYLLQSNSATSYTASNQVAGVYSYRLTACNATGCGAVSNTSSITVTNTNTPIPGVPSPTKVPNVTVITWPTVANASYYETDMYQSGWVRISSSPGTSVWLGGYTATQFRVRACNVNAACSDYGYVW